MAIVTTPKLGIRLMSTGDIQKEVVFNEAAVSLDILSARVATAIQNSPPSSPTDGDVYIVGNTPTSAWAGYVNNVAFYYNGWRFVSPFQQLKMYVNVPAKWYTYSGSGWSQDPLSSVSVLSDIGNVSGATPTDGQVLTYDTVAGTWGPENPPTPTQTLANLTDVLLTSIQNHQILTWDSVQSKFVNSTLSVGATNLQELSDVYWPTSPTDGHVLRWVGSSSKAQFLPPPIPSLNLNDLADVSTAGAVPNDVLAFNGAAWGPSTQAISFSFLNMSDGPQTFEGQADKFLVVDSAETQLVTKSIGELVGALGTISLQSLADVPHPPTDGNIGQSLRVKKTGSDYSYEYFTPTSYALTIYNGATSVTSQAVSLKFQGFTITEPTPDNVVITSPSDVGWQSEGTPVTGVATVNFTGDGVSSTLIGDVFTVDVSADYETLNNLPDLRALKTQTVTANSSTLTIDLSLGENVVVNLAASVTSLVLSNPLASGLINRLVLEVRNTGAYTISNWAGALWSSGSPVVTSGSGKTDRYIISSFDGMTTKYGDIIGQNYT